MAVHNYCRNADYFLRYLAERKIALEAVTPTEVSNYLRLAVRRFRKRHGHAPARYWVSIPRSGIHGLLKLALKRWPSEPATSDVRELLGREVCNQYQPWLREERGLAVASIDALMWEARHFCAWYIRRSGTPSFMDMGIRHVDAYFEMRALGLTRKSLKDVAERLRSLMRHLHRTGRSAVDLAPQIVAPILYAYESIPSTLSSDLSVRYPTEWFKSVRSLRQRGVHLVADNGVTLACHVFESLAVKTSNQTEYLPP